MKQSSYHSSAQPTALQVAGHNDVPQHSPAETIGCGSPKGHEAFASPKVPCHITACQETAELRKTAATSPTGMAVEQELKLEKCAAGANAWPQSQPAQPWSSGCVTNQPDRGHSL